MASRTAASGDDEMQSWLASWTIFYWAWWVSWTPFVGMFIARISRGRTIRQFVTGVLLVPSLVSLVWFAIFGGTAIDVQRRTGDLVGKAGAVDPNSALFEMLDHLPLASVSTVLVMVLVGIFFVSGADAASIVMGTLSEKGSIEPSKRTVIFWGTVMGSVAAIMLATGGKDGAEALTGLQTDHDRRGRAVRRWSWLRCACRSTRTCRATRSSSGTTAASSSSREAVVAGAEEHDDDFVLVLEPAGEEEPT